MGSVSFGVKFLFLDFAWHIKRCKDILKEGFLNVDVFNVFLVLLQPFVDLEQNEVV